jgi:hypothetical protein
MARDTGGFLPVWLSMWMVRSDQIVNIFLKLIRFVDSVERWKNHEHIKTSGLFPKAYHENICIQF